MAVVQSAGSITAVGRHDPVVIRRGVEIGLDYSPAYDAIWRAQPQVRTVTTFLGRNIAQLGLHVFRRRGDTNRERLVDHGLARTLAEPNPRTTRYHLIDSLVLDLAIYDVAYWLKLGRTDGGISVLRLPPRRVTPTGDSWFAPDGFEVTGNRDKRTFPVDQVVQFRGYNPTDERVGVSPLETLRRVLAEEHAAALYREQLWRNGARTSGFLTRPADAPAWKDTTRERFRAEFREAYTGAGSNAGGVPILEDGMVYTPAAFSPEQAQYIEARKLTREEVASAYHIPLPLVGILEHATFSNIKEQHRHLYQDTLGPWLETITQWIELQLLPDYADRDRVYVEFNLAEKLRGSFEEQAATLQTSVGAPWLTRNEARARNNLDALPGGDELVVPLNVLTGGQASPTDSAPPASGQSARHVRGISRKAAAPSGGGSGRWAAKYEERLKAHFKAQADAVLASLDDGKARKADALPDRARWEERLADELVALGLAATTAAARKVLAELDLDPDDFDPAVMAAWIRANARGVSAGINGRTASELEAALGEDDPKSAVEHVFDLAVTVRAAQAATTQATAMAGFGGREGAKFGGLNRKRWVVRSGKPRPEHARMSGETVGIDDVFSNGAKWPGDSVLDDDQRAGCTCDLEFVRED